jgi:serine/threonine-protein kinase
VQPDNVEALYHRALIQAASEDAELRDAKQAASDASRACELTEWTQWEPIFALAAACAESGDFEAALKWQMKALTLVTDKELRDNFVKVIKCYRQRIPLRMEPDLTNLFPVRA